MSIYFCKPGDSNQLQDSYCQFCFIFLNVIGNMLTSKRSTQSDDGNGTISLYETTVVTFGCDVTVDRGQEPEDARGQEHEDARGQEPEDARGQEPEDARGQEPEDDSS